MRDSVRESMREFMRESMRSNTPLRILYAAGPGNIVETYHYWASGQDDPSQVSITLSGQFYDVCRAIDAKAYVVSSFPKSEIWQDGQFVLENRPNPFSSASGLRYHFGQIWYGLGVIRTALRFKATVAIVDTGTTYWFVLSLMSWLGIQVIPVLHCTLWREYVPRRRVEQLTLFLSRRFFSKDCAAIVAVSQDIQAQVNQLTHGQHRPMVGFLPTYRPHEFADVAPPDRDRSPFRVMFAGRIEPEKGVFDLLEIAKRFAAEGHQDIVFEVCGNGSALTELRAAVTQAGLDDRFICHGHCRKEQMRSRLSQSHVVIVPTRTDFMEGFNQVVAEAVLAGRPVVTSAVCPALAYVQEAAIEVPPNDVQAYGDALLKLYGDREFYEQKRQHGSRLQAQFYDQAFSWKTQVLSLLNQD